LSYHAQNHARFDAPLGMVAHPPSSPLSTSARFADAPMGGFLGKYGKQVPEFKRRFFVL
jgi:hypothetical protein